MIEKEKKAIEDLRKILFQTIQANECGLSTNDFKDEIKTYTDILNLIEKLQKENKDREQAHMKLYNEFRQYKDWDSIPKDKIRENSWTKGELEDFYINSVDNTKNPIWTEEHIEELISDFYIIPKELLEEE